MQQHLVILVILSLMVQSGTMPCTLRGPTCRHVVRLRGGEDQQRTSNITPYSVEGETDYEKIVTLFGSKEIDSELISRLERVTGRAAHHLIRRKPHSLTRRNIFFSHRDLDKILDMYEAGTPFYIYTGRGPSSSSLHVGHLIPFMITQWLQEAFNVPVVIQLTDDEKFLWKGGNLSTYQQFATENAKDIMAVGFNPELTYIFTNTLDISSLYPTVLQIQRLINANKVQAVFGLQESNNVGQFAFPAMQIAPSFPDCFVDIFGGSTRLPCLIPCAIDQDPYFRLARDVAARLNMTKPALLHSKFIPALQGDSGGAGKMSASVEESAIYLTDSPQQIKNKINRYAFTGGRATVEEHRRLGGDLKVDVPFRYIEFFHENDTHVQELARSYTNGTLLSGEMKSEAISCLQDIVKRHQERRKEISDEVLSFVRSRRRITIPMKKAA
ncbi:hypothetical protein GUITHDRAFT_86582 [Guillardia theta CCMP2712]|uniref:Tryptophan--tRNA ligase, cytoplasmic n=1 Tax=Guillardia theta (strain CCMP2712) TaxID=905079 RepID=L1JEU8_GUITC|nr:hypothetical protein GUITHDRAFT_86582 [Guillardia theta CCMP2712]EKX47021.1 hypothetical protein GUITHDRAFT_86582 [Guillardia theta CCMP2712]|eukprot:XP_005834001.1 hypothetical protein GUITHDRAFT_86582 [Guillardia theta CCMP2712]